MIKVSTFNDKLSFETKEEVVAYFDDNIQEFGDDLFFDGYIQIDEIRINDVSDWEDYKKYGI